MPDERDVRLYTRNYSLLGGVYGTHEIVEGLLFLGCSFVLVSLCINVVLRNVRSLKKELHALDYADVTERIRIASIATILRGGPDLIFMKYLVIGRWPA